MKRGMLGSIVLWLASAGGLWAQGAASLGAPVLPEAKDPVSQPSVSPEAKPVVLDGPDPRRSDSGLRSWVRAEYLLWRVKSPPAPIPLVTGNNDPTTIAALNENGTAILFGAGSGRSTNPGWFSGGRITIGGWIDEEPLVGWEASGFLLERRSLIFNAGSADGNPPIVAIPINATQPFNGNPAGETTLNAVGFPNLVTVHMNSRLWGAEANGIVNLLTTNRGRLTGLFGFRYVDLLENLTLSESAFDAATNGSQTIADGFGTRNQFYSGQIGLRTELVSGRWSFETTAKVALGSMHQVSNIVGTTTVTNGAFGTATGVTPVGLFAEPSNIGTTSRNVFAVAPEVQFNLAFQVTPRLRSFVGYNFLYLSDVLRPGNQMDRNINPTQNAFLVPPGAVVGPPAPTPFFRSSDFWAQGVNFGLELRY